MALSDGRVFRNEEVERRGLRDFLRWRLDRRPGPWPERVDAEPGPAPAPCVVAGLALTFVGHSTFLLQFDGLNVLTDPIWSERCSPVSFIGPRRVRAPALRFDDLPRIDAVLLSHDHYDHMDRPTLRALEERWSPLFLAGLGNKARLKGWGLRRAEELDWWQEIALAPGRAARFVPARHFSGRAPWDRDRTLWGGFALTTSAGVVYFAGDTGRGRFLDELAERLGRPALALMPIGAYEPRGSMGPVHMNPDDAALAHLTLKPRLSVGMHFGTFRLTDEAYDAPPLKLAEALAARAAPAGSFVIPEFGRPLRLEPAA